MKEYKSYIKSTDLIGAIRSMEAIERIQASQRSLTVLEQPSFDEDQQVYIITIKGDKDAILALGTYMKFITEFANKLEQELNLDYGA